MLLYLSAKECAHAAIAQLDRVTDYESVGRGFESLSPYQKPGVHLDIWFFVYTGTGQVMLHVSDVRKYGRSVIFL